MFEERMYFFTPTYQDYTLLSAYFHHDKTPKLVTTLVILPHMYLQILENQGNKSKHFDPRSFNLDMNKKSNI